MPGEFSCDDITSMSSMQVQVFLNSLLDKVSSAIDRIGLPQSVHMMIFDNAIDIDSF